MVSRRSFLKTMALTSAGLAVGAGEMLNAKSYRQVLGSNKKVNIAFVGIGHRGEQVIQDFAKTEMINVVALCDVDLGARHTQKALGMFPKAKQFKDFRQMFDKAGKEFDAVVICTPDHSHFPISMLAIANNKHVYVEKPMARTFHEAELMMQAARKHPNIVTQVGNQGHSEANYFQFKTWVEAGIIKDVTAVTAHMNNSRRWHKWDTNIYKLPEQEAIPNGLDWMTWLSAVPYHEYNKKYHHGEWRCWYDFGMGALGDWGAHILDTAHEFLDMGLPTEINPLYLKDHNKFFFPMSSTILFKFPERGDMPGIDVTWYDGLDNIPPVPENFGSSDVDPNIPTVAGGKLQLMKLNPGKEIYTKTLTFKGGSHGSTLSVIPDKIAKEMNPTLPEYQKSPSNHYANFLLACQGKEKPRSPFSIAGPLSQVFCLGVLAQRLNRKLVLDRTTKEIVNDSFANQMLSGQPPRKGWEEYYNV